MGNSHNIYVSKLTEDSNGFGTVPRIETHIVYSIFLMLLVLSVLESGEVSNPLSFPKIAVNP